MGTRKLIKQNSREVLKILLNRIGYPFRNEIFNEMENHPNFPSFLSFHHILKKNGIDCVAFQATASELQYKLPKPALVHISSNEGMFLLLEKMDDQYAYFINEKNVLEQQPVDEFLKIWGGYALIVDIENIKSMQIPFIEKIKSFLNNIRIPFLILTFILLLAFLLLGKNRDLFNIIYLILYSGGIFISVLLLIEHFDQHNLFIKKICSSHTNKKINCSSILNSKDAYFIGLFSWSDLGLLFFVILFLSSLLLPRGLSLALSVLSSILAYSYVFYSLYYQKIIAKSWCVLCLLVQGILTALLILSLFAYRITDFEILFRTDNIILLLLISATILALYILVKPLIQSNISLKSTTRNLQILKFQNDVKGVLFKREVIIQSQKLDKIIIGNLKGKDTLTIVFNPICEPCINELSKLLSIIKYKDNTRLELLFLVDQKVSPRSFVIAKNLLKHYIDNSEIFINLLIEYLKQYPKSKYKFDNNQVFNDEMETLLTEIIIKQEKWCINSKIFSTPQIYFNNKKLPAIYSVNDLEYLCS